MPLDMLVYAIIEHPVKELVKQAQPQYYVEMGSVLPHTSKIKRYKELINKLDSEVQNNPDNVLKRSELGGLLMEYGHYDPRVLDWAAHEFGEAIRISPEKELPYLARTEALICAYKFKKSRSINSDDLKEARLTLDTLLKRKPDNVIGLRLSGDIYMTAGKQQLGLNEWKKAGVDGVIPTALFYIKNGDKEIAYNILKNGLKIPKKDTNTGVLYFARIIGQGNMLYETVVDPYQAIETILMKFEQDKLGNLHKAPEKFKKSFPIDKIMAKDQRWLNNMYNRLFTAFMKPSGLMIDIIMREDVKVYKKLFVRNNKTRWSINF